MPGSPSSFLPSSWAYFHCCHRVISPYLMETDQGSKFIGELLLLQSFSGIPLRATMPSGIVSA